MFPILRIVGNLPSENVRFINSERGPLRGFLNRLKSLFGILEGPVLLLSFKVFMYDSTSSVFVASR